MDFKFCTKCNQEKPVCDFHKDSTKKSGFSSSCKECSAKYYRENFEKIKKYRRENSENIKVQQAKYRRENSEKIKSRRAKHYRKNHEKHKEYYRKNHEKYKEYYRKNREKAKANNAKYRRENPEKIKERKAKYRRENREKIKEYFKKCYKNDENFKIRVLLRGRILDALKVQSAKKSNKTLELIGCSVNELWEHLEGQFTDGMTRQNQGEWHIDHIKPCSAFDLTDPKQQKECFNYKNLQPLWAQDNLKKSDKWEESE